MRLTENLKFRDLAYLKNECVHALQWKLTRIIPKKFGSDGHVRIESSIIRNIKREIHELCALPFEQQLTGNSF